jgi:hypothetical protein
MMEEETERETEDRSRTMSLPPTWRGRKLLSWEVAEDTDTGGENFRYCNDPSCSPTAIDISLAPREPNIPEHFPRFCCEG